MVAAWLPGTEGGGVSDVLLGKRAPKGKLSFSWPRSMDQLHANAIFLRVSALRTEAWPRRSVDVRYLPT